MPNERSSRISLSLERAYYSQGWRVEVFVTFLPTEQSHFKEILLAILGLSLQLCSFGANSSELSMCQRFPALQHTPEDHLNPAGCPDALDPAVFMFPFKV